MTPTGMPPKRARPVITDLAHPPMDSTNESRSKRPDVKEGGGGGGGGPKPVAKKANVKTAAVAAKVSVKAVEKPAATVAAKTRTPRAKK